MDLELGYVGVEAGGGDGLPLLSSLGGGVSGCIPLTSTHWSPHYSLHGLGGEPRGLGCHSMFPLCPSLCHFLTKFPELLMSPNTPCQDQREPLSSTLAQPRPVTLAPEPRRQLPRGLSPQTSHLRLTDFSLLGRRVPQQCGRQMWGEAAGQAFPTSPQSSADKSPLTTVCLGF